eukprot:COSAG02_NODE_7656_length_2910_cov_1.630381_6_plen_102_part_01
MERQEQRERTPSGSVVTRGQMIGGTQKEWEELGLEQLDKAKLKAYAKTIDPNVKKATGQGNTAIKALENKFGKASDAFAAYLDAQVKAETNPWVKSSDNWAP